MLYRYNAVRILVRYVDPNIIAGWDGEFSKDMVCYSRVSNISMVIKVHTIRERLKFYADPCERNSFLYPRQDFDMAVTAYRNPFDAACSHLHLYGKVSPMTCEGRMYDQYAVFKSLNVVYEMNYEDLKGGRIRKILRDLAERLNLLESLNRIATESSVTLESIFSLIQSELSRITSPPKIKGVVHHPITLMHPDHRRKDVEKKNKDDICMSDKNIQRMHTNSLCIDLAARGGRMSDALWHKYRSRWDNDRWWHDGGSRRWEDRIY